MGTTTTNIGLTKPTPGDPTDRNLWGAITNGNWDILDGIFRGDGLGTGVGMQIGSGKLLVIAGSVGMIAGGLISLVNGAFKVATTVFSIFDKTDSTKIVQFDASGITTGTTRTLKAPNASGVVALTPDVYGNILLDNYISGLTTANNASNQKIDVKKGVCADSTNAYMLRLASTTTVNFTTTGAGALDTGTIAASTFYYIWVIGKTDGTVSVLGSTSATSPTMPSGYTLKRLVWGVWTDSSSHFLPYTQVGNECFYTTSIATYDGTAFGSASFGPNVVNITGAPKIDGAVAHTRAWASTSGGSGGWGIIFYPIGQTRGSTNDYQMVGTYGSQWGVEMHLRLSSAGTVNCLGVLSGGACAVSLFTSGWTWDRGSNG